MTIRTSTDTLRMLGDTETLTSDGDSLHLTDLLDDLGRNAEVLCFRQGSFYSTCLRTVLPDDPENIQVAEITFRTGEQFTVMQTSSLLDSENRKLLVYSLNPGDMVKTLTYDPRTPHPQLTPKTVKTVQFFTEPFVPVVTFEVTDTDNFLIKTAVPGSKSMVLVPVYPEKVDNPGDTWVY